MKNRLITGILFIILGAFIAFGPLTIFPVCGVPSSQHAQGHNMEQKKAKMSMKMDDNQSKSSMNNASKETMSMGTGMVMKCFYTARAELGIGLLIVILGVLLIIFQSVKIRLGLNISIILNGILALLIPVLLIGVCNGIHMSCHSLTLPSLVVISSILILAALVNTIYLYKSDHKGLVQS